MPRQIVTQASLHPPHKVATPTSGQAILVGSPNAVSLPISKKPKMDTHYDYTKDLLALTSAQSCSLKATLPEETASIVTPLKLDQWKKSLSQHPDKDFVKYITEGIAEGFHVGINEQHPFQLAKSNMYSASKNPDPVESYLHTELKAGRIVAIPNKYKSDLHISRFGVIPKGSQPGKC